MYNAVGLAGFWSTIGDAGKKVVNTVTDFWGGGDDDVGLQDVLSQGIDAAASIIRHGTEKQIAQLFMQRMSPEVRSELEREYIAQHGRQFAAAIPTGALVVGGAIVAILLLRKGR